VLEAVCSLPLGLKGMARLVQGCGKDGEGCVRCESLEDFNARGLG
jgi:hypothetical protein